MRLCYTSKEHWIGTEISKLGGYGFQGVGTAVEQWMQAEQKCGTKRKGPARIVLKSLTLSWRYAAPL